MNHEEGSPTPSSAASESPEAVFKAPAKWERNKLTHSPGYVILGATSVEFHPGSMSMTGKHAIIPLGSILKVRRGDNFLWRGVVKVDLKAEIEGRDCYVFFLGGQRNQFLLQCEKIGILVA